MAQGFSFAGYKGHFELEVHLTTGGKHGSIGTGFENLSFGALHIDPADHDGRRPSMIAYGYMQPVGQ